MERIQELHSIDEQINEIIVPMFGDLIKQAAASRFPKTGRLFIMFLYKTNDIKETVLRTCETGDIYSVKILYRSLIEHFLRFQYIFFRFTQEKTEDIGVEYYTVSRQQKWHRLTPLVRGDLQVFSCMQENT